VRGLSVDELRAGYRKALANAHELIAEADLLVENMRYPRAYFLAHIAGEEIAKGQHAAPGGIRR
jgi:AbiV family abortive infection protein